MLTLARLSSRTLPPRAPLLARAPAYARQVPPRAPLLARATASRWLSTQASTESIVEIQTPQEFDSLCVKASATPPPVGGPVIVDFYADWCTPPVPARVAHEWARPTIAWPSSFARRGDLRARARALAPQPVVLAGVGHARS